MSGGVGPTATDITLPEDNYPSSTATTTATATSVPSQRSRRRILSFRQLNALAVAVVLSFSGMVSLEDSAFSLLALPYVFFLASFAFPSRSPSSPSAVFPKSLVLTVYISAGALLGLFIPIAYILHGVVDGDKEGIKAAAPHVFLLASQIFMEGVTFNCDLSSPMRALVPVFFNGRRLFTIAEWVRNEIDKVERDESGSEIRVWVGRVLAVANLGFWSFNLFGFLLPVYLPRAMERYYAVQAKVKL